MRPHRALPTNDLEFIRLSALELWPDLRRARIFITGATGFFGRWLLESLFLASYTHSLAVEVTALSRDPEDFRTKAPHLFTPQIRWLRGSVATLDSKSFEAEKFDFVIHLATEPSVLGTESDPAPMMDVIVNGTRRILDIAEISGARRFLFTSSGAVYGRQDTQLIRLGEDCSEFAEFDESTDPYARSGKAKREAEIFCIEQARNKGFDAIIARGFSFGGPGLPFDSKFAFGNFARDAVLGGPIKISGTGTARRSYLYAADLTVWLWTLLLKGKSCRPYNVGSESPVTIRELAETFSKEAGNLPVSIVGAANSAPARENYVPSTMRARTELGLTENFSLEEMVRRTLSWYRN
jgi:nucleoside-diphosphate-sugar epimerase